MNAFNDDDDKRKNFRTIFRLLNAFREVDRDIPISTALVFCWVALNEGATQVEMRNTLDMPSATSSRNLAALSKVHRLGKPGLDLIEWVENPEDRRAKLFFLSRKGEALLEELLVTFG
ncbi:hypothetical protein BVC71_09400 [Marivivens niveibacter]|uniref:MarR family transcriptional regulator n=1 Tax=Marivivens niveibacter TaxID=1930667 RepID=A0A251WY89_9RHOB|nr:MarR family winged helix-turn-helix transcriptional regulator [Marivivens niveibacter]OUD09342.1 hypothetical protein BVC71_09400 [Marivivens niveibacter]